MSGMETKILPNKTKLKLWLLKECEQEIRAARGCYAGKACLGQTSVAVLSV